MRSTKRRLALAAVFCASFAGAAFASTGLVDAAPSPPELILPCEEEVVFGTIVVLDPERGLFGLAGTEYQFFAEDPEVLGEIDGLQVRMEVASDCSIRTFEVIGDGGSLTQLPAGPDWRS